MTEDSYVDYDRHPFIRISHLSGHKIIVPSSSDNRGCTVTICMITITDVGNAPRGCLDKRHDHLICR